MLVWTTGYKAFFMSTRREVLALILLGYTFLRAKFADTLCYTCIKGVMLLLQLTKRP